MRKVSEDSGGRHKSGWRIAPWIAAALALLLPLAAMQVTDEVAWSGGDFALLGAMLFGACGAYELGARLTGNATYRAALATALVTALGLSWITLAVGIIGSEDDPANLMYFGVLALGLLGAFMVRFRPGGMAHVLGVTAVAQAAAGIIALIAGLGSGGANWPGVVVLFTGVFVLLWLASAWLFRRAARERMTAAAPS
ncbi:hypothetical protein [Sabulicella glaciei]|uniref:DUF308 domain-containing protein n=1 Tax=Sabulicella glaciei TaxID=2984948 RepID=A0ABT3NUJ9_9PROT|nr:hypothetical protein [Roseococcus sp. MDT2-1-1]MCW8085568.1 hypothetical protein [Roseococcus sp. MDT2-1-1]